MLSTHYRSPLDYSDKRLEEAASALKRFYNTFSDVRELPAIDPSRCCLGANKA
jgi:cysteinyl-tRNA synthetase